MSSRIIVKNLPNVVTAERLTEHFSKLGQVTDVRLVHTPSGMFRRFAFIGYHDESQANNAAEYFNKTFIDACKIEVELAKPYGDKEILNSRSRYSKGSINKKKHSETENSNTTQDKHLQKEYTQRLNQTVHKSKLASYLGELYELETNPEFAEFLSLHKSKSTSKAWTNDDDVTNMTVITKEKMLKKSEVKQKVTPNIVSVESRRPGGKGILLTRTHFKFEGVEEDNEEWSKDTPSMDNEVAPNIKTTAVSDMDYLKSKIVKKEEEGNNEEKEDDIDEEIIEDPMEIATPSNVKLSYTLKMRGVPFSGKPKDVRAFFYPLKLSDIRMVSDKNGKPTGIVYVDFCSQKDMMDGLRRNRDCMGRRYIELFKEDPLDNKVIEVRPRPWEQKLENMDGVESIGESGRLFIRNLSYSITEDDITQLFNEYGPLSEVLLPLDKMTKKPIGLGFVTFMLPEHAVKAYSEMDGKIFHGRLIHILPSKPPSTKTLQQTTAILTSSYKQSKEAVLKKQSSSAHNWNSLFLGSNAVVDSMADRYDIEKSDLLDPNTDGSLAVRLALGETQLVTETREFLEGQGVVLDVFQQIKPKRSKKIILLKNLVFGTTETELKELFEPFGSPARVILPPGGVSALVEFSEASTAKKAFKKLAYNEFKHIPLYLEWAPIGVLDKVDNKDKNTDSNTVEDTPPKDGSTVFVKNINFNSNEEQLSLVFSKFGKVRKAVIARKINMKNPNNPLSMGYGFVEYERASNALKAIKEIQGYELDGHNLELKLSHSETHSKIREHKKVQQMEQKSSKLLVRNIPFEAGKKEISQLFGTFGKMKNVRLPKKVGNLKEHRGFCFVEFVTKDDAKRAFDSLCHSTHLYGRRLVLEWAELEDTIGTIRQKTARYFTTTDDPETSMAKKRKKLATELFISLETSV